MSDPPSVARRFYEAFNAGDFGAYAELLAEDVLVEVDGATVRGRAEVCAYAAGVRHTFPGIVAVPQHLVVGDDDTVVVELQQTNPAADDDPTSWRLAGTVCEVLTVRGTLISGVRSYYRAHPDDRTSVSQTPLRTEAYRLADEQGALRRIATLVAEGASEREVFDAVNESIALLLRADATSLFRFESDDALTLVAAWSRDDVELPLGERRAINPELREIRTTGRPRRFDRLPDGAPFVEEARDLGIRSAIGVPIALEGDVWGIVFASSAGETSFPADTEARMVGFTELVATALANAQARTSVQQLVDEQAALRRVAELVARGAPNADVLEAVVREACELLGVHHTAIGHLGPDGSSTLVATYDAPDLVRVGDRTPPGGPCLIQAARTRGGTVRIDSFAGRPPQEVERACALGITAGAAALIVVDGEPWGGITAMASASMPAGIEDRLAQFADLTGTAISRAHARGQLHAIATEQAALRRVAELVARGVAQEDLFASVAAEASTLIDDEATTLLRFDADGCATVLATCRGPAPVGARFPVFPGDDSTPARVLRTGRPARLDVYPEEAAPEYARAYDVGSSVGAPVIVEDRVWGMLGATTPGHRLPFEAEVRLQQFAELAAAAIANAQARAELQQLADEQAALRRVAELVAQGVPPEQLLDAVVAEASTLLDDAGMSLLRFRSEGDAVVVATHRESVPVGVVIPADGAPWAPERLRRQRAVRVSSFDGTPAAEIARRFGVEAVVVVPVMVEARVWGMLSTTMPGGRFPAGAEERLAQFAELVGTAVANAESRAQLTASRARVVAAADESRRRVQRDVHDGAQQRLVQTVINLKLARQALEAHPWPAAHLIDESLLHAERANAELRDLVRGILPASLTRGGLRAGIESLCADLPIDVELRVTAPRLPVAAETTAYFVVAEALANVVKHAGATCATVTATTEQGTLMVEVRDDGVGGADAGGGSGLTGLFDRVEAGDGTLVVESPAGGGTTLRATLPVTT